MTRLRKTGSLAILLLLLVYSPWAVGQSAPPRLSVPHEVVDRSPSASPTPRAMPSPTTPVPVVTHATLVAIGDVLIHSTVYHEAGQPEGTHDFNPMFEQVRDRLMEADVAVANQESIIGGRELGLSTYPLFNSPHEIGDALQRSGIDIVTTANNHAMDKGEKGILSAAAHWNKIGMPYTGAFVSQEDRDRIRIVTRQRIAFAFLAYTYGTNGIPVPADKSYLVNRIDEERMKADIGRAGKLADVVVVSVHWGVENEAAPNGAQTSLARNLADWGADIVIGTHPHVLQPFAWISRSDGKRTLVMYSLGNFLSAQEKLPQLIGGIARIEAVKTVARGETSVELVHPAFFPTYNKYEAFRHFRIVPFDRLDKADAQQVKPVWQSIKKRLLTEMPELDVQD